MSQIGRLLQGGILGGAQAYEDAARLHLAQEQARRDAQFDPMRMQQFQAELEERQAVAGRMRRKEAATKLGFDALRGMSTPLAPGQAGPVQPQRALDMFDAQTLADMDTSVRTRLFERDQDADAFNRKMAENKTLAESARAYGLFPHLGREAAMELVTSGFATIDEFAKNPAFRDEAAERDTDTKKGLITLLTVNKGPDGKPVFDSAAAMDYMGMSVNELKARLAVKEKFEAEQAAAAQAAQQQQALAGQAQQLGIDPGLAGIMTGAQLGEIAQRRAMPAGTGQGMLTPSQALTQAEQEYANASSTLSKSGAVSLGALVAPTPAEFEMAMAIPPSGADDDAANVAKARSKVNAWRRLLEARARVMGGGGGAGVAAPQPSPDLDAAAISAFTQRFGVPPDPSNPQHVDAFAEIEAQLQGQR